MKKVAVLVDYENIAFSKISEGKVVDFPALIETIRGEIGVVKVALAFLPIGVSLSDDTIRELDKAGIDCVVCPRYDTSSGKEKDRVDSRMIALAKKLFDEHSDVTDIALVSNDGDFTPLATFFKQRGKFVTLFGIGKISGALRQVVNLTRGVPVRDREV